MNDAQDKNDFYSWVAQQKQSESPFYPPHPSALDQLPQVQLPKGKYEVFYRQFNLAHQDQVKELEETVNRCLASPNWVLIREEWSNDHQGNRIITIKYMHVERPKKKSEL